MPIVGEVTRASLRKVIEGAARLGLIPDPRAALEALSLSEREALIAALRRCELPPGVWAAIQRAWADELRAEPSRARVRLGDYELVSELGRGGMGAVYRARDRSGRELALKVCSSVRPGDKGLRRFQRECEQLTRMQHPHVVRCLASGAGPPPWLAMELVEGQDLDQRLRAGPLAPAQAARVVAELAEAVAYAHSLGVLHRDLKPSNVLLRADGRALLTDFGLVRVLDASRFTETGCLVGTPLYMAPEQARGAREDGVGVDVWGLGAILYHALTGQPPLRADSPLELLIQLQDPRISSPDALNAQVPAWLARLTLRCLARDPRARPSAAQLASALRAGPPAAAPPRPALVFGALTTLGLLGLGLLAAGGLGPGGASEQDPPGAGPERAASHLAAAPQPELEPPWEQAPGSSPLELDLLRGAAWREGRVDPLAPEARDELFAGAVTELAEGRLRVDYSLARELLQVEPEREDVRFAEGVLGLVEERHGGLAWDLGSAGGALLGRALWRSALGAVRVRAGPTSWRLVISDPDRSGMIFPPAYEPGLHGARPRGLALTFHSGGDAFEAGQRWSDEGLRSDQLRWLELRPGAEAPRARWGGRGLGPGIDQALADLAPDGALGLFGPIELLSAAWLEGLPLRPDRLAGAEVARWGARGELAAAFAREPSPLRRGGPFLARGQLRCELSSAGLRLVVRRPLRRELILAAQPLEPPRAGWLRLAYRDGCARAELWRGGQRLARLEAAHLPSSAEEAARVGSVAEAVTFPALRWRSDPGASPAYDEWVAAAQVVRLGVSLGGREAAGLAPAAPPSPQQLQAWRERLEACAREELPAQVQTDALLRAAQLAVIAGDAAAAQRLGDLLRGRAERADLLAGLDRTGLPASLRSLLLGWGRYTLPQSAAGHVLARALLEEGSLDWQRNLAGEAGLFTQRYRKERRPELLDEALRLTRAAWEGGLARPAQEGELLNLAGRPALALERLAEVPPSCAHWWPFYQRALARLSLGDERGACEDAIASFARSRHRMARSMLEGLIPRLGLRAALAQLALFHVRASPTPPLIPPESTARDPRERALLAYLRQARGLSVDRSTLAPDEPHSLLALARAGDARALERLPEAMRSALLVDAFARLDPELRTKTPLLWR